MGSSSAPVALGHDEARCHREKRLGRLAGAPQPTSIERIRLGLGGDRVPAARAAEQVLQDSHDQPDRAEHAAVEVLRRLLRRVRRCVVPRALTISALYPPNSDADREATDP